MSATTASTKPRGRPRKAADNPPARLSKELHEPTQYQREKSIEFEKIILPISAIGTGALTMMAAPNLIEADSVLGIAKVITIGVMSGFVSFTVNDKAIKAGAKLASHGFRFAFLGSVLPITIIGISAGAFSYSGLVLKEVNALNRQQHAEELRAFVSDANAHVVQTIQIRPALEAAASDIRRGLDCEKLQGCLSSGKGGEGSVYRAVLPLATRAEEITTILNEAEQARRVALADANALIGQYETILAGDGLTPDESQRGLARKSSAVKDKVEELRLSLPASLFESYAVELQAGIKLPDQPEAMRNVNAMLARNGASIQSALDSLKSDISEGPAFPAKAGISQAIAQLGAFWPIAVLTAMIELTIPLVLWLFTYLGLIWARYRVEKTALISSKENTNEH